MPTKRKKSLPKPFSFSAHAMRTGHLRHGFAKNGALTALWFDEKAKRPRVTVAYVGENGIKPDTWYALNGNGEFVEVPE